MQGHPGKRKAAKGDLRPSAMLTWLSHGASFSSPVKWKLRAALPGRWGGGSTNNLCNMVPGVIVTATSFSVVVF